MDKKRDGHKKEELDLSQLWLRHLRQNAKPHNVVPPCRFCRDHKICQTEESLWAHVVADHPEEVPKDREAQEAFRRQVLSNQAPGPIRNRPRDDSAASKPHEQLAAVSSELPKSAKGDLESNRSAPAKSAPLTASGLQILTEENSDVKYTNSGALSSVKRRAIGHGRSPSSSVRTTYSNDSSRRIPAKGVASNRVSSPPAQETALRKAQDLDANEIHRPPATGGKRLFQPDSDSPYGAPVSTSNNAGQRPKSSPQQHQHRRGQSGGQSGGQSQSQPQSQRPISSGEPGMFAASVLTSNSTNETAQKESLKIVRQPETRPISQEQLVAEVKGIYAGLVMVEGKCIQVDAKQAALSSKEAPEGTQPKLNNEQWQALIALHRTLLHEHHDFFLASQHPSATVAVRNLAIKYAMPARLWRHGIHSFLELLRNRLPDSLDHMLAFIYLAYSMMTLLYETVPAFEETWIECLGDLGRYRMAIEDDDIRDREVWTQVARQWYLKASDRSPDTGRLYHHLAILARPNVLQQLFFYYKSLSVPQIFTAGRESILTIFQPVVDGTQAKRLPVVISTYIKVHAILFTKKAQETFDSTLAELPSHLSSHIGRVTQKYLEQGYYIAISNILMLLGNGDPTAVLSKVLFRRDNPTDSEGLNMLDTNMTGTNLEVENSENVMFERSRQLFVLTIEIHLQRVGDPNILSFLHVTMVFMVFVSHSENAMKLLEKNFPRVELVAMLNSLLRFYHLYPRIEGESRPIPAKNDFRPVPEEFAMRGLEWAATYSPPDWFANKNIEEENQYKEDASMNSDYRPERILWLGCRLAKLTKWIAYDDREHKFFIPDQVKMNGVSLLPGAPSDVELDLGNESSTDTATIMADSDADERISFASRTSTGISEKTQSEASNSGNQSTSTWESSQDSFEDRMDMTQESPGPF